MESPCQELPDDVSSPFQVETGVLSFPTDMMFDGTPVALVSAGAGEPTWPAETGAGSLGADQGSRTVLCICPWGRYAVAPPHHWG